MNGKVRLEPLFKRVIVEFEDENPHRQKMTKGGIIIPSQDMADILTNRESEGIVDGGEKRVKYGIVVEVSSDCVSGVAVGDEVICDSFQGMPVAMGMDSIRVLPETGIIQILRKID